MTDSDTDVLIVGAGPTGLTMALELSLHKIPFRIVEKLQVRSVQSRALVMHPRSLELLRRHGISEKIQGRGTGGKGTRFFINKKQVAQLDFQGLQPIPTQYSNPDWISQADIEAVMAAQLESEYGVKIERGLAAKKFEQDATGVSVTIERDDGQTEHMRCKYVVGCDGAHSTVRHESGLPFVGAPFPQSFMLCDTHLRWDMASASDSQHLFFCMADSGTIVLFPFKDGSVQVVARLPDQTGGPDDIGDEPTLDDFQKLFDQMAPGTGEFYDPIWISKFKLHHRLITNYRNKRMFVAGDAAHIHGPAGGQGMNTGVQDAVNLGWKLSRIISGVKRSEETNERLLNSYNEERYPVGQYLQNTTDKAFSYLAITNPWWVMLRNFIAIWILPWFATSLARREKVFRFVSGLGIRYRRSPIVGTSQQYTGSLKGGDRAPDGICRTPADMEKYLLGMCRGDMFHLILFSGIGSRVAAPKEMTSVSTRSKALLTNELGKIEIHKVYSSNTEDKLGLQDLEGKLHRAYGFDKPGYVLIRPDAYIAHIGLQSSMDDMLEWVKTHY